jgi:hypothetical protein
MRVAATGGQARVVDITNIQKENHVHQTTRKPAAASPSLTRITRDRQRNAAFGRTVAGWRRADRGRRARGRDGVRRGRNGTLERCEYSCTTPPPPLPYVGMVPKDLAKPCPYARFEVTAKDLGRAPA